jgi:beta-1,4-mannosyl-glycoprotein beta-1,4-N-acetylglucosaminyltransferase
MIYDCFTFFNELEILEIRLHEMDPWVDRFVLVESEETFSGNSKPLFFEENKDRFERFLPKIIHLISPLVDKSTDAWDRQDYQRNYAMEALSDCADGDLILIGDVDEIVRGQDFTQVERGKKLMTTFLQKNYIFYMNLLRAGAWPGTVMMPYRNLESSFHGSLWEARRLRRKGKATKLGGWHFTKMGGKDDVVFRLKSSCHFNTSSYKKMASDSEYLHDLMEGTRMIKRRKLNVVPIGYDHPDWFVKNIEKFDYLLTKEVKDADQQSG